MSKMAVIIDMHIQFITNLAVLFGVHLPELQKKNMHLQNHKKGVFFACVPAGGGLAKRKRPGAGAGAKETERRRADFRSRMRVSGL